MQTFRQQRTPEVFVQNDEVCAFHLVGILCWNLRLVTWQLFHLSLTSSSFYGYLRFLQISRSNG